MDAVITYVDGRDPLWRQDYAAAVGPSVMAKRFRDYDTLRYLLRGLSVNMPFVRNVFLVVSRQSQVPSWVDRSRLRVVLHEDIIPEHLLPVFNSSSIELFLHRIPGLGEQYLYFNDDMFPVRKCREGDFFKDGKGFMGYSRHFFTGSKYLRRARRGDSVARSALSLKRGWSFVRPQHICSTMLRRDCEELYAAKEAEFVGNVTKLRTEENINQYVYLDYSYYKGNIIPRRISARHISLALWSAERIRKFLSHPDRDLVCINDVHLSEEKFVSCRAAILVAFSELFPSKSCYEL